MYVMSLLYCFLYVLVLRWASTLEILDPPLKKIQVLFQNYKIKIYQDPLLNGVNYYFYGLWVQSAVTM